MEKTTLFILFFVSYTLLAQRGEYTRFEGNQITISPGISRDNTEEKWNDVKLKRTPKNAFKTGNYDSTSVVDSVIEIYNDGNKVKHTYTYDSNNNWILYLIENWDGSQWVNSSERIYDYDSNKNIILQLDKYWDENQWVNLERATYTYDSYENMTSYLKEEWDRTQWVNEFRNTYSYDSDGNMTLSLREDWVDRQWLIISRYTYTYDSYGNMTSYLNERWSGTQWKPMVRIAYTYDFNRNITSSYIEVWDDSQLVTEMRDTYTYDYNGDMISYLSEEWDGGQWILRDSFMSFYDSFGRYYEFLTSEINVYYSTITDVKETVLNVLDFSISQNYPNPFNPSTTIKYSIPSNVKGEMYNVKLIVYDVLGREVTMLVNKEQKPGNYEIKFEASALSSGLYFYRIKTNEFSQTKKMILLK